MNLTEIRMDRTKSLGNHENLKLGFTAVLEEGETETEAVDRLRILLDWEINYEERSARYKKLAGWAKQLAGVPAEEMTPKQVQQQSACEAELTSLDEMKQRFETLWPNKASI